MEKIKDGIRIDYEKVRQIIALRGAKQLGTIQEESAEMIAAMANLSETVAQWIRCEGQKLFYIDQSLLDNIIEEMADVFVTIENVKELLDIKDDEINLHLAFRQISLKDKITNVMLPAIQAEANEFIKALSMLIQAIAKWTRVTSGDNYLIEQVVYENIIIRMAGVYSSMENVRSLIGVDNNEINDQIEYKQNKLAKKIAEGKITA